MATGFVYDPRFLDHDTGPTHPEKPARLTAALSHLETSPQYAQVTHYAPRAVDLSWLESTHSLDYIKRAKAASESGQPFLDTPDVAISKRSFDVAVLACGAPLALADALMNGEIRNGFAMVRPPGHHAESQQAMGFCLFNNVAILARYLQQHYGLNKLAIIDWDVHHGNGTQHSFEEDPSVLYISTHQYPYYPGSGAASETGIGRGRGATLNCPMPAGATDSAYQSAFHEKILPKLNAFKPDALIISAGFDAHYADPLAEVELSTEFFSWMSERLVEVADQHAGGRIISVLEGGYNLKYLGECIAAHLKVLVAVGET